MISQLQCYWANNREIIDVARLAPGTLPRLDLVYHVGLEFREQGPHAPHGRLGRPRVPLVLDELGVDFTGASSS